MFWRKARSLFFLPTCLPLFAMPADPNTADVSLQDIMRAITTLTQKMGEIDTKMGEMDTKIDTKMDTLNSNIVKLNANVISTRDHLSGLIVENTFALDELLAHQIINSAKEKNATASESSPVHPVPKYDRGTNELVYPCPCEPPVVRGSLRITYENLEMPASVGRLAVGGSETGTDQMRGTTNWNQNKSEILLKFYDPHQYEAVNNLHKTAHITYTSRMMRLHLCEHLGICENRVQYLAGEAVAAASARYELLMAEKFQEQKKRCDEDLCALRTQREAQDSIRPSEGYLLGGGEEQPDPELSGPSP